MWKAKVFLSDYDDMCHTHLSGGFPPGFPETKRAACFTFLKLYALDLMMAADQIRVKDGTFQKCTVNKYLSLQALKCIYQ